MLPAVKDFETWCPGWKLGDKLPVGTNRDRLGYLRDELAAGLEPSPREDLLVAVEAVFAYGRAFNIRYEAADATRFYLNALADYPSWAISAAVSAVMTCWDDTFRLPLPGEIVKAIPGRYWRLKSEQLRLEQALRAYDRGEIDDGEPYADPTEATRLLADLVKPEGEAA